MTENHKQGLQALTHQCGLGEIVEFEAMAAVTAQLCQMIVEADLRRNQAGFSF